jgi:cell division protein FtsB
LKPVVNSSLPKITYTQVSTARAAWWALKIPNYVWLAMIMAAAAALSLSTLAREREEVRRAQAAFTQAQGRVAQVQTANQRLKTEVKNLKNDPRAAERAAQERLNYVRPNEIVVAVP